MSWLTRATLPGWSGGRLLKAARPPPMRAKPRAHILRRDPTAAINLLLQAEAMAPDVIRHDPDSLDTVREMAVLAKRVRGKELGPHSANESNRAPEFHQQLPAGPDASA